MNHFFSTKRSKPHFFILMMGVALLVLCSAVLMKPAANRPPGIEKPNIIIMLLDDAGYADFGFMGSGDLLTPNIDSLAASAIRFTDAHVSASVCSPSRAGLLTGKYQQRFGYECNEGEGYTGMDAKQTLLPQLLRNQGYTTAAFGKWHIGFEPGQQPLQKGFQYFYGFLSGGRSYFYRPGIDDQKADKRSMLENLKQVPFNEYLTDVLGDKAVDYIRQNSRRPFFMYWAPNAVHTPMEATVADLARFAGHPRQQLAAMTFALDRSVGKIVNELKKQGLFNNTLLFFLSDNGGAHNNQSSNFPLKGFKGNKYEGGHRVPFLVSWPAQIKGGTQFNGLTSALDIFSTALHAAGTSPDSITGVDGVNLLPFLTGAETGDPHDYLVWRKDAAAAIRFKQFKLTRVNDLGERLYDMHADPKETRDVSPVQPEISLLLRQKLLAWEADKMSPIWTEGKIWDTITLMIHDDLMHNRAVRVRNPEELNRFKKTK